VQAILGQPDGGEEPRLLPMKVIRDDVQELAGPGQEGIQDRRMPAGGPPQLLFRKSNDKRQLITQGRV
jgi:hypothetical protein